MANNKKIPYFCRVVLQNFPFIEEDFDALTTYQLISKVVEFLNKVIKSQNTLVDNVNNLSLAFQQLHDYVENYFDNLDVQEEINNKLDQMAEDGTLQEIITAYIQANVAWSFNTVADMKLAENFVNGSYAQTFGFHSLNDGGGALYKIRTVTNDDVIDEATIIALADDTLVAELIINEPLNVKQVGAKGDGVTDDTARLQIALNNAHYIYIPDGTYMVDAVATSKFDTTAGLVVRSNSDITISENAILKVIPNSVEWYSVFHLYHVENIKISGGKIIGDRDNHTYGSGTDEWGAGIKCINAEDVTIRDIEISKCTGDGIEIGSFTGGETNKNITIDNCTIDNVRRNGISIEVGDNFRIVNTNITNINGVAPQFGIDIEPNNYINEQITNVLVDKCYIADNTKGGIDIWRADNVTVTNSYFKIYKDTLPVSTIASASTSQDNENIIVEGNTFECKDNDGFGWYVIASNNITKGNRFKNIYIYLTTSEVLHANNSLFDGNIIEQGLFKTGLGGGSYTVACHDTKISNNIFNYTLSGENLDPTGSDLNGLQFEFGTRDVSGGKKISGIVIDNNIFEYLNTNIFVAPVTSIQNKTSFDLGLLDSEFKNNTLRNLPYSILCSKLPNVNFVGNKLYNVGFLWAYRAVSIQNDSDKLFRFTDNQLTYDGSTPPTQVVFINGLNYIANNILQSVTQISNNFFKLQDGAISYAYDNFALGALAQDCVNCYTNNESLHGENNIA